MIAGCFLDTRVIHYILGDWTNDTYKFNKKKTATFNPCSDNSCRLCTSYHYFYATTCSPHIAEGGQLSSPL